MNELLATRKDFECPYAKLVARIQRTVVCAALLLTHDSLLIYMQDAENLYSLLKQDRCVQGVLERLPYYHAWNSFA